jgi:hypothetical protein
MLSTAIILPKEPSRFQFDVIRKIKEIEWDGMYYSGERQPLNCDSSIIFSSPEIIPLVCDLLIVADPKYCTLEYLSFAIRNGCHLFISDQHTLTMEERKQLIQLAHEGGTNIQIQNEFLFHPFQKEIQLAFKHTALLEISQTAPQKHAYFNELLYNNLFMLLRTSGALVHKAEVYSGQKEMETPEVININVHFKNGTAANLTMRMIDHQEMHTLSITANGELTIFDFINHEVRAIPALESKSWHKDRNAHPLEIQLSTYIQDIYENRDPEINLHDDLTTSLLLEKIRDKIRNGSPTTSIHH